MITFDIKFGEHGFQCIKGLYGISEIYFKGEIIWTGYANAIGLSLQYDDRLTIDERGREVLSQVRHIIIKFNNGHACVAQKYLDDISSELDIEFGQLNVSHFTGRRCIPLLCCDKVKSLWSEPMKLDAAIHALNVYRNQLATYATDFALDWEKLP